jgi:signal transduction histidine kinase
VRLGLRARAALAFAALAFLVSVGLATLTYQIARTYLLDQRETLVVRQAGLNARTLNAALAASDADVSALLANLPSTSGSRGIVNIDGEWFSSSLQEEGATVPSDVVDETLAGHAVKKRVNRGGTPTMVVGVPLTQAVGAYFEIAPLGELQRTLSVLAWSLTAAAAFTTVVGASLGVYASRRLLRPLREFSYAAAEIGHGRLDTRLSVGGDPDLAAFGETFNEMAEALEHRTERDARFASDVSHELRNPLTALTAAVDVLDARADERARPAVDVVRSQVAHFRQLVLDLLELSRLDSGPPELMCAEVDPHEYFPSTVAAIADGVPTAVAADVPRAAQLDQRRVERVIANLIDNAQRHAGGATGVSISAQGDILEVAVDDAGPGVPEAERTVIFDRFHRGPVQNDQETGARGSGLGLAIVAEQCRAHGGDARVEERPGGGARFVATFRSGGGR